MKKETKLAVAAVVLLVVAGILFVRYAFTNDSVKLAPMPTKADIEKQITDIQNNPKMPEAAKAIAIGQIRAHAAGMSAPAQKTTGH